MRTVRINFWDTISANQKGAPGAAVLVLISTYARRQPWVPPSPCLLGWQARPLLLVARPGSRFRAPCCEKSRARGSTCLRQAQAPGQIGPFCRMRHEVRQMHRPSSALIGTCTIFSRRVQASTGTAWLAGTAIQAVRGWLALERRARPSCLKNIVPVSDAIQALHGWLALESPCWTLLADGWSRQYLVRSLTDEDSSVLCFPFDHPFGQVYS